MVEAKSKKNVGKVKNKRSYKAFLNELLDGSFMTRVGIRKNYRLMLLVVGLIFVYINNHYAVIMRLSEIDTLQKELLDVKYEALTRMSDLMKESRQSSVLKLIEEKDLKLEVAKIPHYTISRVDESTKKK
jgi:hypothetical protein